MNRTRCTAALSLLAASALVLSACGSNSSSSTSASGLSAVPVTCGGKKKLQASGATAQENAMEQFVYAYVHACPGYTLDYNANGSGAGVKQFVNNETDLAGSGEPLDPSKGEPDRAATAVRFAGVGPAGGVRTDRGHLQRQRGEIAETGRSHHREDFQRQHHRWNDPAIKALNADTNLPSTPIHVIFRSDKSGNTYNFQQYLDAASNGAWGKGAGETFDGGVGQGATGNKGTSALCGQPTGRSPTTSGRSRWASS